MSVTMKKDRLDYLELEYEIMEPPEKVWRAVSIPEFREKWLHEADLAQSKMVDAEPGVSVSYKMKQNQAPHLESTVTFQIFPGPSDGTILRIIHVPDDVRRHKGPGEATNSNIPAITMAA